MTILFYDLETTGIDAQQCGIHQISGAVLVDGKIAESFNYHVKPREGCLCEPAAMALAGHTYEEMMASDEYRPMKEVFKDVFDLIVKYDGGIVKDNHPDYNKRIFLGGFNIHKFDNDFLRRWFEDNEAPYGIGYYVAEAIDVMLLAVPVLMKFRHLMPGFTQEEVAWALGVELDSQKLHDACYDIFVCIQIYLQLVKIGCLRAFPTVAWDALHPKVEVRAFKDFMIKKRREKKALLETAQESRESRDNPTS